MDLDAFNQVVEQFNTVFPSTKDPMPYLIEELGEYCKEISINNKTKAAQELADVIFVALGLAIHHNLDLPGGLAYVANKNITKMRNKEHMAQDPITGKWLKPEDAAKLKENTDGPA